MSTNNGNSTNEDLPSGESRWQAELEAEMAELTEACERAQREGIPFDLSPWQAKWEERRERDKREAAAAALAAAADGTGPQPSDRDWHEAREDFLDLVMERNWGWHITNDLLEVLAWALASPQGQRAQAARGEPNSPWEHTLHLIHELQTGLLFQTEQLLVNQARVNLGYDMGDREGLNEALNALRLTDTTWVTGGGS